VRAAVLERRGRVGRGVERWDSAGVGRSGAILTGFGDGVEEGDGWTISAHPNFRRFSAKTTPLDPSMCADMWVP
jgi:hypothetical protein